MSEVVQIGPHTWYVKETTGLNLLARDGPIEAHSAWPNRNPTRRSLARCLPQSRIPHFHLLPPSEHFCDEIRAAVIVYPTRRQAFARPRALPSSPLRRGASLASPPRRRLRLSGEAPAAALASPTRRRPRLPHARRVRRRYCKARAEVAVEAGFLSVLGGGGGGGRGCEGGAAADRRRDGRWTRRRRGWRPTTRSPWPRCSTRCASRTWSSPSAPPSSSAASKLAT